MVLSQCLSGTRRRIIFLALPSELSGSGTALTAPCWKESQRRVMGCTPLSRMPPLLGLPLSTLSGFSFLNSLSLCSTEKKDFVASNLLTTVGKNVQITIEPKEGVSIEPEELGFPVTRTATGGLVINSGTIHFGQNRSCLVRLTVPPGSGSGPASNWINAKISYELPGRQIRETTATVRSGDNTATIKVSVSCSLEHKWAPPY